MGCGEQRRMELAMPLATNPQLRLIDKLLAGMGAVLSLADRLAVMVARHIWRLCDLSPLVQSPPHCAALARKPAGRQAGGGHKGW